MTASIKPIDAASVHQITSGQVITDLQTAVKELVENSLDAGATIIDIKFKNYGSTSFEVADNGSGVQPKDYAQLALKGYTSKLDSYEGLTSVTSFGFRGEALSSLCQLADVTVTTATEESAPIGNVLSFKRRGALKGSIAKVARAKGTTVSVANLFAGMPVRKKEFDKNSKKHFGAAQNLLQAYGLISVGTRITLSNQTDKKPALALFKTEGKSLRENYATLFGPKPAMALQDLDIQVEVEAAKRVLKTAGVEDFRTIVRVRGLVSPPLQAAARTGGDRQFLFVNGRPFESKPLAKAFNEVYKSYVPQHVPCVVANFELATDAYDVNVSPDKRSIFLHSEQNLIDALKLALDAFYSPSRSTFVLDSSNMTKVGRLTATMHKTQIKIARTPEPVDTSHQDPVNEHGQAEGGEPLALKSPKVVQDQDFQEVETVNGADSPDSEKEQRSGVQEQNADVLEQPLFREETPAFQPKLSSSKQERLAHSTGAQAKLNVAGGEWNMAVEDSADRPHKRAKKERHVTAAQQATLERMQAIFSRSKDTKDRPIQEEATSMTSCDAEEERGEVRSEDIDMDLDVQNSKASDSDSQLEAERSSHSPGDAEVVASAEENEIVTDVKRGLAHQTYEIEFDLVGLTKRQAIRAKRSKVQSAKALAAARPELEEAGIRQDDADARKTLSRLVSKADFAQMQIVGQFNLAFIIARRREAVKRQSDSQDGDELNDTETFYDDLMIIDQHASDEKYNFERLQQVTKIDSQRLIKPRTMEMPASDELLAVEHEDILKLNGFEIEIDAEEPIGKRIKLVSMPVSKSTKKTEFTIEDFEELLYLLREHSGQDVIRPTKTRKLFAMLACRSSVMVGKVLSHNQMKTIVQHMGTIEQPWNCPHGRNTMRWLTDLEPTTPDKRFTLSGAKLAEFMKRNAQ